MGIVKQFQKVVAKAGVAGKLLSAINNVDVLLDIKKVTLTAAQIKALFSTPQTLIAAPGAGKYIKIDSLVAAIDYSGGAFAGDNNLEIRETNGAGTKVTADLSYAFLQSTGDAIAEVSGIEAQTTRILNAPIVVCVPAANPTGAAATSTITFTLHYKTLTVY